MLFFLSPFFFSFIKSTRKKVHICGKKEISYMWEKNVFFVYVYSNKKIMK